MSDDLDDLKRAMNAATPAPDAGKKAETLALARKNFDALQERRTGARPTSDRPGPGIIRGVARMISTLNTRGALTATTALVALGLVVVLPDWHQGPGLRSPQPVTTEADAGGPTRPQEGERTDSDGITVRLEDRAAGPVTVGGGRERTGDEKSAVTAQDSADEIQAAPAAKPERETYREDDTAASQPGLDELVEEAAPRQSVAESASVLGRVQQQGLQAGTGGVNNMIAPKSESVTGAIIAEPDTEAYPDSRANPLKITAEDPVSTFSIDVDTASYAVVRSSLTNGSLPPEGAVRIEEMVNYFPYDYPAPDDGEAPFKPKVTVFDTPWNPDTQLVHIGIQGQKPAVDVRPPLNLVFLIDTSGSMDAPNKLPLLKQSLALMLPELTERDEVAIVTYAGSAGQVLAPTPATDRETIMNALDRLRAGGSTAGQAGLQQSYSVAGEMTAEGEVTRVILATDGDFNVGLSDPQALKTYIADKRETGTYLSVMGFGRGNLDDATMQALAQNGNGQAAFIDTLSEAQKVLVDQFTGALFPIADDVKIQVEFNPAQIVEYRLIGYETRVLNREDFNNDRVDAGDIGAGHSVTALYEVTPVGSPAQLSDPLRYQAAETTAQSGELGYLKLRYKAPGASNSRLIETPITQGGEAGNDMRFAAAIAGFGQLLGRSPYLKDWDYDAAIALANAAKGDDPYGYRAEAVRLMRLAQSLSRN